MDKNTAINQLVELAANIMENKAVELEFIRQMFEENGDVERVERLTDTIKRTTEAVEFMRLNGGCWA